MLLNLLVNNPATFHFHPDAGVWGSGLCAPVIGVVFYLTTLYALKKWIAGRKEGPFELKAVQHTAPLHERCF
jgi:hypothetical protein